MHHRRSGSVALLVIALALIAAACAPAAPPDRDWRVTAESITVHEAEDDDAGDEPYVVQIGFRSKLGVSGSTSTSIRSQCRAGKLPTPDQVPAGTTYPIPAGSADIAFNGVKNLDVLDLAGNTAPFEVLGTLAFVMERDGILESCAMTDLFDHALRPILGDALALLVANSPVPPTQEELIDLIVSNLGSLISAVGDAIAAVIEGFGNPDDLIGVAAQIHLPTIGGLTDLINTALAVAGLFSPGLENGFIPVDELPSTIKIRVGTLSSSSVNFRFTSDLADYTYRSTVTR